MRPSLVRLMRPEEFAFGNLGRSGTPIWRRKAFPFRPDGGPGEPCTPSWPLNGRLVVLKAIVGREQLVWQRTLDVTRHQAQILCAVTCRPRNEKITLCGFDANAG